MTVTVSDVIAAAAPAAPAAEAPASAPTGNDSAARAQARRRDAGARARLAPTQSMRKRVAEDFSHSWVWRDVPPSLNQIVAGRIPDIDRAPSGSRPVRAAWVAWNYSIAIPMTAVLYILAWLLQHPARAAVLAVVAGPLGILWITN